MAKAAVFAAALAALFTWVFGLAVVQGSGMKPTSGDGDVVLFDRLSRDIAADDVIVYHDDEGQQLVGRVVALPGDTVEVTDDGTFEVNGNEQPSPTGEETQPGASGETYPLTLQKDEYFVLGDSRMQAVDSRETGPIGITEVEGKVIALLRLRGI